MTSIILQNAVVLLVVILITCGPAWERISR